MSDLNTPTSNSISSLGEVTEIHFVTSDPLQFYPELVRDPTEQPVYYDNLGSHRSLRQSIQGCANPVEFGIGMFEMRKFPVERDFFIDDDSFPEYNVSVAGFSYHPKFGKSMIRFNDRRIGKAPFPREFSSDACLHDGVPESRILVPTHSLDINDTHLDYRPVRDVHQQKHTRNLATVDSKIDKSSPKGLFEGEEMGSQPGADAEMDEYYHSYTDKFGFGGHRHGSRMTEHDGMWNLIKDYLASGTLPVANELESYPWVNYNAERFRKQAERFFLGHRNRLYLKPGPKSSELPRLVIEDESQRKDLMFKAHHYSGHRGRDSTHTWLKDRFYWPNMYMDVDWFVRSCNVCQLHARAKPIIKINQSWPSGILRHFHFDTIHMPDGENGMKFIFQATDAGSTWDEAKASRINNSDKWAAFVFELICRTGGIIHATVDGGPEFKGLAKKVFDQYGVIIIISTPYHPQSNGIAERHHSPIKAAVLKCAGSKPHTWPRYLHPVLLAKRTSINRHLGATPYYLHYGLHPILPFDLDDSTWETIDWDKVVTTEDFLAARAKQIQRRDDMAESIAKRVKEERAKAIKAANERYEKWSFTDYRVGMWVWLRQAYLDNIHGSPEVARWTGPYIIYEKHNTTQTFLLMQPDGAICPGRVNIALIKMFYFRPDKQTIHTKIPSNPSPSLALSAFGGPDVLIATRGGDRVVNYEQLWESRQNRLNSTNQTIAQFVQQLKLQGFLVQIPLPETGKFGMPLDFQLTELETVRGHDLLAHYSPTSFFVNRSEQHAFQQFNWSR